MGVLRIIIIIGALLPSFAFANLFGQLCFEEQSSFSISNTSSELLPPDNCWGCGGQQVIHIPERLQLMKSKNTLTMLWEDGGTNTCSSTASFGNLQPYKSSVEYKVHLYKSGTRDSRIYTTASRSFSVEVQPGYNYNFRVQACDKELNKCSLYSSSSNSVFVTGGVPKKPASPIQISTSRYVSALEFESIQYASTYKIKQVDLFTNQVNITSASVTNVTIPSISNRSYSYSYAACNDEGCSEFSESVSAMNLVSPLAPTNTKLELNSNLLLVSWDLVSVSHDEFPNGIQYVYQLIKNGEVIQESTTEEQIIELNLSGRGEYSYKVKTCAKGSLNCSGYSNSSETILFKPVPPEPQNLRVEYRELGGEPPIINQQEEQSRGRVFYTAVVLWDAVRVRTSDFPLGIRYKVSTCVNGYQSDSFFTNNTSYIDKYITNKYPYSVATCDTVDTQNCSLIVKSGDGNCIAPPPAPSPPVLNVNSNILSYSFEHDSRNTESYPHGFVYKIYLKRNGSSYKSINVEETSGVISTILSGEYQITVKACVKIAQGSCSTLSDYSNEVEVNLFEHASTTSSDIEDSQLPDVTAPTVNNIGTIKGQAGVSGGAATYNIPIELPPGRAGMQPNVSLNYSSRSGNGIAGVGWSLSAGQSITRCPATFAQDGFTQNPQYNSNDKLCLNGQRLMLAEGGTYGANGAIYRTEIDSFVKVTQSGGLNGSNTSFTVKYKNGRTAVFGESEDSRIVHGGKSAAYSWLIEYEHDSTTNNFIHYEYTDTDTDVGEKYISEILYTGSSTTSKGNRKVVFNYEDLPISNTRYFYQAGGEYQVTKLLSSITSFYDDTQVAIYNLGYKTSDGTNRKLLNGLTLCFANEACLPVSTFNWSDANSNYQLEKLSNLLSDVNDNQFSSQINELDEETKIVNVLPRGDLNGDGVRDWRRLFINAEAEITSVHDQILASCYHNRASKRLVCTDVDFDRDGKSDEYFINSGTLQIDLNSGTSINTYIPMPSSTENLQDSYIKSALDYNGDGWPDLLIEQAGEYSHLNRLYLHTGDIDSPYNASAGITVNTDNIVSARAGGVIHSRVLVGETKTLSTSTMPIGDIDGNGLPDLLISDVYSQHTKGYVQPIPKFFLLNYGGSFSEHSVNFDLNQDENLQDFSYFVDINGDGLSDWIGLRSADNYKFVSRLNLGNGNFSESDIQLGERPFTLRTLTFTDSEGYPSPRQSVKFEHALKIQDIDGDGISELLVPGERLLTACASFTYSGRLCGTDLYGSWKDSSNNTYSIDPLEYDRSVYRYKAIKFAKSTGGNWSYNLENTDIIGTAYESGFIDAFGNGLPSLVSVINETDQVTYDVENSSEDWTFGEQFGVFLSRNYGSGNGENAASYHPQDLMLSIDDGLSTHNSWTYWPLSTGRESLSNIDFYELGNELSGEYLNFSSSMYAVATHRFSNGLGTNNQNSYSYRAAVFNTLGRGFMGFKTIVKNSEANELITQTDFRQEFPYQGKIQRQATFKLESYSNDVTPLGDNESDAINLTTYTWGDNPSHDLSGIYHIYPSSIVKIVNDLDGNLLTTHTTQNNEIDEFGNITDSTFIIDDEGLTRYETNTVRAYDNDANTWFINKLTSSKVEKTSEDKRNSASDTKTVATIFSDYHANRKPRTVELKEDSITGDLLKTTTTVFNDYGLPTSITETATTYAINGSEQESNRTSSIDYTKNGTIVSADGYFPFTVTNAKGHTVTTNTNPATGQPTTVRKQIGASAYLDTVYGYDGFNRLYSVQTGGQPIRYSAVQKPDDSAPANAVMQIVTKSAGTPTNKEYKDKLGRTLRTAVQGFANDSWIYNDVHYDNEGQVTFESVPFINATSPTTLGVSYSEFDVLGRPKYKVTSQSCANLVDGTMTAKYTYTGFTTEIDVSETCHGLTLPQMKRTYNSQKQLMSTVDAIGGTTTYSYNSLGLPTVIQDANSDSIVASYDSFGRKTSVNDPNQGYTQFTYNGFGELQAESRKQTANSSAHTIVRYAVDELGRVTKRRATGESDLTYNYDTASNGYGQLGSESSNGVTRTYAFDSFGRPTTTTIAGSSKSYTISTLYDANFGRVKGLRYPNNLTVKYEYNTRGFLTHIKNAANDYVYQNITEMDKFGNIASSTLGNGLTESNLYYAESGQMANKIVNKTGQGQLLNINYSAYDGFGNLKGLTVNTGPIGDRHSFSESFEYDHLHRLTSNQIAGITTTSYRYDSVGNITYKSDYATTYDYDTHLIGYSGGGNNAVKKAQKTDGSWVGFSYDARGNMTKGDGLTEALYNAMDKPTSITKNDITNTFVYGPDHMRFKQTKSTGSTIYYADKLYEEEVKNGETTWRAYIGDVAVVSKSDNGLATIRYTHRDRLGSARLFTDRNGNVEAQRNYDSFGKPREANKLGDLGTAKTRRGFTDHEHLDDMELIHMNGRVYDYNLGRFMSVDPVIQGSGNSQGINPYSYIMNNPLGGVDPTGYSIEEETVDFDVADIQNIEVYADGSITVNFNNGAESQSFANAKISDGNNTVDIGGQINIAKRHSMAASDVYNSKSQLSKAEHGMERLSKEQLTEKGLNDLPFNDDESGFKSALYFDYENDNYIYAFAGTEDGTDWAINFAQGRGKYSEQHQLAVLNVSAIRQAVGKNTISTTGHSLGGGLASLAAMSQNLSATTFNAAGIHQDTLERYGINPKTSAAISAFYVKGEVLNSLQDTSPLPIPVALGTRYQITSPSPIKWWHHPLYRGYRSGQLHKMGEVQKALDNIK